ncbi:hypothetical protein [Mycolicibacterium neworleansense]|nr:hypothetical protein [Mycolicibacterium neworleansense]
MLRFFGDQLFYRPVPDARPEFAHDVSALNDPSQTPGEPYHPEYFAQLR